MITIPALMLLFHILAGMNVYLVKKNSQIYLIKISKSIVLLKRLITAQNYEVTYIGELLDRIERCSAQCRLSVELVHQRTFRQTDLCAVPILVLCSLCL